MKSLDIAKQIVNKEGEAFVIPAKLYGFEQEPIIFSGPDGSGVIVKSYGGQGAHYTGYRVIFNPMYRATSFVAYRITKGEYQNFANSGIDIYIPKDNQKLIEVEPFSVAYTSTLAGKGYRTLDFIKGMLDKFCKNKPKDSLEFMNQVLAKFMFFVVGDSIAEGMQIEESDDANFTFIFHGTIENKNRNSVKDLYDFVKKHLEIRRITEIKDAKINKVEVVIPRYSVENGSIVVDKEKGTVVYGEGRPKEAIRMGGVFPARIVFPVAKEMPAKKSVYLATAGFFLCRKPAIFEDYSVKLPAPDGKMADILIRRLVDINIGEMTQIINGVIDKIKGAALVFYVLGLIGNLNLDLDSETREKISVAKSKVLEFIKNTIYDAMLEFSIDRENPPVTLKKRAEDIAYLILARFYIKYSDVRAKIKDKTPKLLRYVDEIASSKTIDEKTVNAVASGFIKHVPEIRSALIANIPEVEITHMIVTRGDMLFKAGKNADEVTALARQRVKVLLNALQFYFAGNPLTAGLNEFAFTATNIAKKTLAKDYSRKMKRLAHYEEDLLSAYSKQISDDVIDVASAEDSFERGVDAAAETKRTSISALLDKVEKAEELVRVGGSILTDIERLLATDPEFLYNVIMNLISSVAPLKLWAEIIGKYAYKTEIESFINKLRAGESNWESVKLRIPSLYNKYIELNLSQEDIAEIYKFAVEELGFNYEVVDKAINSLLKDEQSRTIVRETFKTMFDFLLRRIGTILNYAKKAKYIKKSEANDAAEDIALISFLAFFKTLSAINAPAFTGDWMAILLDDYKNKVRPIFNTASLISSIVNRLLNLMVSATEKKKTVTVGFLNQYFYSILDSESTSELPATHVSLYAFALNKTLNLLTETKYAYLPVLPKVDFKKITPEDMRKAISEATTAINKAIEEKKELPETLSVQVKNGVEIPFKLYVLTGQKGAEAKEEIISNLTEYFEKLLVPSASGNKKLISEDTAIDATELAIGCIKVKKHIISKEKGNEEVYQAEAYVFNFRDRIALILKEARNLEQEFRLQASSIGKYLKAVAHPRENIETLLDLLPAILERVIVIDFAKYNLISETTFAIPGRPTREIRTRLFHSRPSKVLLRDVPAGFGYITSKIASPNSRNITDALSLIAESTFEEINRLMPYNLMYSIFDSAALQASFGVGIAPSPRGFAFATERRSVISSTTALASASAMGKLYGLEEAKIQEADNELAKMLKINPKAIKITPTYYLTDNPFQTPELEKLDNGLNIHIKDSILTSTMFQMIVKHPKLFASLQASADKILYTDEFKRNVANLGIIYNSTLRQKTSFITADGIGPALHKLKEMKGMQTHGRYFVYPDAFLLLASLVDLAVSIKLALARINSYKDNNAKYMHRANLVNELNIYKEALSFVFNLYAMSGKIKPLSTGVETLAGTNLKKIISGLSSLIAAIATGKDSSLVAGQKTLEDIVGKITGSSASFVPELVTILPLLKVTAYTLNKDMNLNREFDNITRLDLNARIARLEAFLFSIQVINAYVKLAFLLATTYAVAATEKGVLETDKEEKVIKLIQEEFKKIAKQYRGILLGILNGDKVAMTLYDKAVESFMNDRTARMFVDNAKKIKSKVRALIARVSRTRFFRFDNVSASGDAGHAAEVTFAIAQIMRRFLTGKVKVTLNKVYKESIDNIISFIMAKLQEKTAYIYNGRFYSEEEAKSLEGAVRSSAVLMNRNLVIFLRLKLKEILDEIGKTYIHHRVVKMFFQPTIIDKVLEIVIEATDSPDINYKTVSSVLAEIEGRIRGEVGLKLKYEDLVVNKLGVTILANAVINTLFEVDGDYIKPRAITETLMAPLSGFKKWQDAMSYFRFVFGLLEELPVKDLRKLVKKAEIDQAMDFEVYLAILNAILLTVLFSDRVKTFTVIGGEGELAESFKQILDIFKKEKVDTLLLFYATKLARTTMLDAFIKGNVAKLHSVIENLEVSEEISEIEYLAETEEEHQGKIEGIEQDNENENEYGFWF